VQSIQIERSQVYDISVRVALNGVPAKEANFVAGETGQPPAQPAAHRAERPRRRFRAGRG